MEAAGERARAAGLRRVVLGVRVQLPLNFSFYRSLGYRVESEHRHPGYEQVTWLQMEKAVGGRGDVAGEDSS